MYRLGRGRGRETEDVILPLFSLAILLLPLLLLTKQHWYPSASRRAGHEIRGDISAYETIFHISRLIACQYPLCDPSRVPSQGDTTEGSPSRPHRF